MNAAELSGDTPSALPSNTGTMLAPPGTDDPGDGLAIPGTMPDFWPTTFRR